MPRPLKEAEKLSAQVTFRVQGKDAEEFLDKVKKSGLSRSEYGRRAVIRHETEIIAVEPKLSEPQRELLFVVKKASNNINQLAHKVNAAHLENRVDDKLYADTLSSLDMILRYLKATL